MKSLELLALAKINDVRLEQSPAARQVSGRALSKTYRHFSLAIARSERLATVCLISALCFSSSAYAEGPRVWSRMISSEPANSADRAQEFVLYGVDQGDRHLVGTWSYGNGAVGNETPPPRVVIGGTKTADGIFWPDVRLEVRKGQKDKWERIPTSPNHGERATVTIEPNAINLDLMVNLDAFKPLLNKYESGRIVLKTGRSSEFELKDLLPPEREVESKDDSAERLQIMSISGPETLAQANPKQKAPVQQRNTRARNDYFVLYSWKVARGEYDFALVAIHREKAFVAGFDPARSGVGGSSRLKAILSKLPSRSLIVWEEANDVGLELPPPQNIDDVVSFARTKNIRVELNPTLYE
jgi:hypothetical protein